MEERGGNRKDVRPKPCDGLRAMLEVSQKPARARRFARACVSKDMNDK